MANRTKLLLDPEARSLSVRDLASKLEAAQEWLVLSEDCPVDTHDT